MTKDWVVSRNDKVWYVLQKHVAHVGMLMRNVGSVEF